MFTSPIFLGTLALLGVSLMACTSTTQIPIIKVARRSGLILEFCNCYYKKVIGSVLFKRTLFCRWSFVHSPDTIKKQEFSDTLPNASVQDFGVILMGAGYEVNKIHCELIFNLSLSLIHAVFSYFRCRKTEDPNIFIRS